MGEIRSIVLGVMLFSIVVTGLFFFESDLAANNSATLSQNLSSNPDLVQLQSMNQQLTSIANQTAQVNYNQQGLLGSFGFLAVVPVGFLNQLQQIWIISTNGLSFIITGVTTFLPIPAFIVQGVQAMVAAILLLAFIGLILGRNI